MRFEAGLYEHAAKLIGRSPTQVSRDGELLFAAHAAAYRLYRHTPVVAGIDLYNIEAEALGAQVILPAGNAMPSIAAPLCHTLAEVEARVQEQAVAGGRIEMTLEAAEKLARTFPQARICLPVTGPFTLASHLLGLENLLMLAMENTEQAERTLLHLSDWLAQYCQIIAARGLGIVVFESAAAPPMLSPSLFAQVVFAPLRAVLAAAKKATGAPVRCIIGGNTALIAQNLAQAGAGQLICPFETDQQKFLQEISAFAELDVRINMDARVFLQQNPQAALAEAERVCKLVRLREKACVGTGVVPLEAVPETVLAVRDFVRAQV